MIRAFIVDDEPPARDRLRQLLSAFEDIEVIGEAGDGLAAIEAIPAQQPDLVFLDIEMPASTGLQVAAALPPPRPSIVFCTAYDQYAIEAFELYAVDYVLKPINSERLARAVERVRRPLSEARRIQREFDAAQAVQARLFPQRLPPMSGLDYWGVCRPASAVGGDYYDFIPLGSRKLGLALGDVSGKGIYAGLLMASLQGRLQTQAPVYDTRLDGLVADLNNWMHSATETSKYATFFYGLYADSVRRLTYVNAGHNPPILIRDRSEGKVVRLEGGGTVIGLFPDAAYRQETMELEPADVLLIFSDGLTEAVRDGSGEEFGESRLRQAALEHAGTPARELCQSILSEVERFSGRSTQQDDLTLIVAKAQ